jgi:hypothetical protein
MALSTTLIIVIAACVAVVVLVAVVVPVVVLVPGCKHGTSTSTSSGTSPAAGLSDPSPLPQDLYMTGPFAHDALPAELQAARQSWVNRGPPGMRVHWFDDAAAEQWIGTHAPQYAGDYAALVPGAFKADLWRLLVLYEHGGVYVDTGTILLQPLWQRTGGASLVFVREKPTLTKRYRGYVWQGVLAATARHPLIRAAIDRVVHNIRNRVYGANPLCITGPGAVGHAFRDALGDSARARGMLTRDGEWVPGHYGDIHILSYNQRQVSAFDGRVLVQTKTPNYYKIMYTTNRPPRYNALWKARAVFK